MLKKLWGKLFGHFLPSAVETKGKTQEPRFPLGEGFYREFSDVPNGYGGYRPVNVYLRRIDDPDFRRCIIDGNGRIRNFPGIREGEWKKDLEYPLDNKVRFAFWIGGYKNGKAAVSWTLQPDGRYFEDEDGFGAEDCEEICLYSSLDAEGMFTEPFYRKE